MTAGVRRDVRPGVRPDVRPDVRAAPVSSEEKKKTRGVRGAAAPRPISVKGGVWGGEAPPAKIRGVWGAAPPSQNGKFFEKFSKFFSKNFENYLRLHRFI